MSRENVTEAEKEGRSHTRDAFSRDVLKVSRLVHFLCACNPSIDFSRPTLLLPPPPPPPPFRYTGIVARNASISASYKSRMDFRLAAFLSQPSALCVSGIRGWNKRGEKGASASDFELLRGSVTLRIYVCICVCVCIYSSVCNRVKK